MKINSNFTKLQKTYIFAEVAERVKAYKQTNPNAEIVTLGIGDVSLPLVPVGVEAMNKAATELGQKETFRGYGDEQGYLFLREALCNYVAKKGFQFSPDEIFINEGIQSEIGSILDLFGAGNKMIAPNPAYPLYAESNVIAGNDLAFVHGTETNSFLPMPNHEESADVIYLCSPSNPAGSVYNREQLKEWVDYAIKNDAIIIFDGAYESFIRDKNLPRGIYEIDGAKECVIGVGTFSKSAAFTGIRCGCTIIPKELERNGININRLYLRRQNSKYNGVSYVVQRAAEAVLTEEGLKQNRESVNYYLENANIILEEMKNLGFWMTGGQNSPFIWLKCPEGKTSWEFFDYLLENANVVGTPGIGFGDSGEGYFRFSALGSRENIIKAMERISHCF